MARRVRSVDRERSAARRIRGQARNLKIALIRRKETTESPGLSPHPPEDLSVSQLLGSKIPLTVTWHFSLSLTW